jgi:hypothetical protein
MSKSRGSLWVCKCKCGKEKLVKIEYLINRRAKGCRRCSQPSTKYITGKFRDLWYNIKRRCNNPSDTGYKYYGGRGIKVCDRWLNSFEDFVSDMGMYPTEAHEIDRINNDGNYEPGNCRWATRVEQNKNNCANRRIEYNGEIKLHSEWSKELGITQSLFNYHLKNKTLEQIFNFYKNKKKCQ